MHQTVVVQEGRGVKSSPERGVTKQRIDEENVHSHLSSMPSTAHYYDGINNLTSGSWPPEAIPANHPYDSFNPDSWLPGDGSAAFYSPLIEEPGILLPFGSQPASTQPTTALHDNPSKTDINLVNQIFYRPTVPLTDEVASGSEAASLAQTPHTTAPPFPPPLPQYLQQQVPVTEPGLQQYKNFQYPIKRYTPSIHPVSPPASSQENQQHLVFLNRTSNLTFVPTIDISSAPGTLASKGRPFPSSEGLHWVEPTSLPKRKATSLQAAQSKAAKEPRKTISEFVTVFENSPGALSSLKRRRKLDAPVRKAAKEVRKAGACHQCRFRKRTCSTGTPCASCLKYHSRLSEVKCQRDSPFVGKLMHQYFEHSSTRRVVSFDISIPRDEASVSEINHVSIDGVGHLSHPLRLPATQKVLESLSNIDQKTIKQTEDLKGYEKTESAKSLEVLLLEEGQDFGTQVEQWAVEYTAKFVHAAGPEFHSTTMAQILGLAYVRKGLPEANLVASMLRVAALAFVLRAGVKVTITNSQAPPRFRTIQARIDTILYERLKIAEKDLFQRLQMLIFRTAGCLNRDQVYPVALVMWQLMRILTIGASHLANIVARFRSTASTPADYQLHGLKLLISTHLALFRSSSPLLLDFRENFNKKMLGDDEELVKLAMRLRKVVLDFRLKGFPDLKGSIVWNKEYFEMFRRVFDGL